MLRHLLIATAALAAGAAQAAPTFVQAPDVAAVAAAYPAKARAEGVGGVATVSCTAGGEGVLLRCLRLGEEPGGYGFGIAALKLVREMRVAGATRGAEVVVPVRFAPDVLKPGFRATTPVWAATPSAADFQATVPKQEGGPNDVRVALVCDVQAGGVLSGCVVDREEPAGQGFGDAVLALAPKFKVEPWSAEGLPVVGGKVRVPVRYDMKPVDQAAR
jgi:TonB family protein